MKLLVFLLSLLIGFTGEKAMAVEEPSYEVVAERDGYEIRRYVPYLVAETVVDGDIRRADNSGFRILAGYIFGKNRIRPSMTTTKETADGNQKIAMTAPVLTTVPDTEEPDRYVYSFVMPAEHSLDTLPIPLDDSISFREVPARLMAVRRYSGRWQQSRYAKHTTLLEEALRKDGVEILGEPILARYNAPFVPGFLRRNEVMIEVAPTAVAGQLPMARVPATVH